jgi:hypothetical protein
MLNSNDLKRLNGRGMSGLFLSLTAILMLSTATHAQPPAEPCPGNWGTCQEGCDLVQDSTYCSRGVCGSCFPVGFDRWSCDTCEETAYHVLYDPPGPEGCGAWECGHFYEYACDCVSLI